MRPVLKFVAIATALFVLLVVIAIGDLTINKRRIFYALLGRDAVVAACTPVLAGKLKASGFEPMDLELGDTPDLWVSTTIGKSLSDSFTFQDGAAQARVDGVMACAIRGQDVTVEFKTSASPIRAT